jgi:hypothetical protein
MPAEADAGSAFVFVRFGTSWIPQAQLIAPDAFDGDNFGSSVALDGDTVVVGVAGDDTVGTSNGSAYVFVRFGTVWSPQAKITAPDAEEYDYFGSSVGLDGDTAVVGAVWDNLPGASNAGSAYVFVRSGSVWTYQAKLIATHPETGDNFGYSVAVDEDTAVVGAILDDSPAGSYAGSATVFVRSGMTWTPQAKLTAPDAAGDDQFGSSVDLTGGTAVVGAYQDDVREMTDTGSAYVFVRSGTTWIPVAKLRALGRFQ